jgi:hypothetical protein
MALEELGDGNTYTWKDIYSRVQLQVSEEVMTKRTSLDFKQVLDRRTYRLVDGKQVALCSRGGMTGSYWASFDDETGRYRMEKR